MSRCMYEPIPLTLYDPEENRETVHFFRERQDGTGAAERITHQRLAELLSMDGRGEELALSRFDKLCAGETVQVMSLHEYRLDPADAERVKRNNAAALAEWDAVVARAYAKGLNEFDL